MYKIPKFNRTRIRGCAREVGETIEMKVQRIVKNGEPISDSSPRIFTERKEGVQAQYDIRTDRWEVAVDAMDAVAGSLKAKREKKGITKEDIVPDGEGKDEIGGEVAKA